MYQSEKKEWEGKDREQEKEIEREKEWCTMQPKLEHPENSSKTNQSWLLIIFEWKNIFFLHRKIQNSRVWAIFIMIFGRSNLGTMFKVR